MIIGDLKKEYYKGLYKKAFYSYEAAKDQLKRKEEITTKLIQTNLHNAFKRIPVEYRLKTFPDLEEVLKDSIKKGFLKLDDSEKEK